MFFKAFRAIEGTNLPLPLTFNIEHQASQVLADGNLDALQRALDEENLPDSLFSEVEFFGSIPRDLYREVKEYFQEHEQTLKDTAQRLINEPDNETLRDEIRLPLRSEDELRNLIGLV